MDSYSQDANGYNGIPVLNHTSQMFGEYGSDSSVQFSGNHYADNDAQGGLDDNGDPKRRRIARVSHLYLCPFDHFEGYFPTHVMIRLRKVIKQRLY